MAREDELIQRIAQGDFDAVDELITMFYPEILRYCIWHTPDRSLAEDAAQETFLKTIRYFDRYTHKGRFKSFLYQIALNTCIDLQRKNRHTDVSLEESAIEIACSEPAFEAVQSDMALRQMIDSLPRDLQEIVLLRFGQELTLREIAKIRNLPLRTVQSKLRSSLRKLRAEMEMPIKAHTGSRKKIPGKEPADKSQKEAGKGEPL